MSISSAAKILDKHWLLILIIYFIASLSLAIYFAGTIWNPLNQNPMELKPLPNSTAVDSNKPSNPGTSTTGNTSSNNISSTTLPGTSTTGNTSSNNISSTSQLAANLTPTPPIQTQPTPQQDQPTTPQPTTPQPTTPQQNTNSGARNSQSFNNSTQTEDNKTKKEIMAQEIRLFQLAFLFGMIGASIHALTSLAVWYGKNKLEKSFLLWYITRPLIGASLALIVYLLLRASLLNTFSNGGQFVGDSYINEFGVAGISALVGLMTTQMTQKLRDVFDSLFGIQKGKDKGEVDKDPEKLSIIPTEIMIMKLEEYVVIIRAVDNDQPLPNIELDLVINDNKIIELLDKSNHKSTDKNGIAIFKIKGKEKGKTIIYVSSEIKGTTQYNKSTVIVTDNWQLSFPDDKNPTKKLKLNETLDLKSVLTKPDGKSATTPQKLRFATNDPTVIVFIDNQLETTSKEKETDTSGTSEIKVKGIKTGKAIIFVSTNAPTDQAIEITSQIEVEVTP
jgi:hypothetical protein